MHNPAKILTLRIGEVRNSFCARENTENTLRHDARKEWAFCRCPELVVSLLLQLGNGCCEMRTDVGGFRMVGSGHCWWSDLRGRVSWRSETGWETDLVLLRLFDPRTVVVNQKKALEMVRIRGTWVCGVAAIVGLTSLITIGRRGLCRRERSPPPFVVLEECFAVGWVLSP
jgi:hypothetical protein